MIADDSDAEVVEIALWFSQHTDPRDCFRAFEAYGHAMTAASTFEQLMALMILKSTAERLGNRAGVSSKSVDVQQILFSLRKCTYSKLRTKLFNNYKLSTELKSGLADGEDSRNHLAHSFWQAHMGNLLSAEGVDIIAAECWAHANHFRLLATALFEETGVDAQDYIVMLAQAPDRQAKTEGWFTLLAEHGLA